MLRYVCNNDKCRHSTCLRHAAKADTETPRIDLCGASQCAMWAPEDDGDVTLHPPLKR